MSKLQRQIIVASKNPVKINAALDGFVRMFPKQQFEAAGVSVASGVADQPMSNDETLQGARNRALNAQHAQPDADFWVGLEGGCEPHGSELLAFAWAVVIGKQGQGKGKTGTYYLPPAVAALVHQGKELGEADDIVFGQTNSKQATGAVGLLTGDLLTRSSFYAEAVILALIPFNHAELYFKL